MFGWYICYATKENQCLVDTTAILQSNIRTAQFSKQNLLLCAHAATTCVQVPMKAPRGMGPSAPGATAWVLELNLGPLEDHMCSELLSHLSSSRTARVTLKCFELGVVSSCNPNTERLRGEICQEFEARTRETLSPPPLPKSLGPQHLGNEYKFIPVGKLKVLNTELWCVT